MPDNPIEVLMTLPFNEGQINTLREVSPRFNFILRQGRKAEEISNEDWAKAEILYTDRILPTPNQVPRLRWIQFHFAGVDFVTDAPVLRKPDLVATTLSGAAAPQIGEYAVMMMLALGHRLPDLFANQQKSDWPRDRWERFSPVELRGATVGLVGYGSINREIARLLQPLGSIILAAKQDVMNPRDSGYTPKGLGDPDGDLFTRLYPIQALKSMLKECDFICVALPLYNSTRGLINAEVMSVLKPTAYLIDFSRGGITDQVALIAALQDKKLAGAALDVFPEEPLPQTSPLWRMPNVIVTPHIGGVSPHYNDRAIEMFSENLRRYLVNDPLYNQFSLEKGY